MRMMRKEGNYSFFVELGSRAQASFRIARGDRQYFFPDMDGASPHDQYVMKGPIAAESKDPQWTVGRHENDEAQPGSRYEIRLFLDESGNPVFVDWPPVNTV